MISSSVRRVTRPSTVSLPHTRQPRTVVLATSANANGNVGLRGHHRTYSSSKPPVPPSDGSSRSGIDATPATGGKAVNPANKRNLEKREGRATKKRGKENGASGGASGKSKQESSLNLPSVPSTQHLHPHDIHVASFFSGHRPMSITTSVPPNSATDAFSSIFSSKKQSSSKQGDVIYTLSSAVNAIESGLPKNQNQSSSLSSSEDMDLRTAVTQASSSNAESDVTHLDGVPMQDLRVSIQDFAKRLRPFNPPPPPVPMDSAAEGSKSVESESNEMETSADLKEQRYSTVLTIHESSHSDGSKSYEAFTTPFVRVEDKETPASIEEGNTEGRSISDPRSQITHRQRIRREQMHMISVRRQRKLKMKKHKYKKLMRKTRTLRRKLDKA